MAQRTDNMALRILVMGCGSIGMRHIRNLLSMGVGQVLAVDVAEERRRQAQAQLGVEALEDLEAALARGPDIAVVASPTHLHVEHALLAAEQGCHLFVEKPLTDRLDGGIGALLARVREKRLVSIVGCNMRFHPGPAGVKRLLEDGAIGRVLFARLMAGSYLPEWRQQVDYRGTYSARAAMGGGVVLDAIHEIDLARWYLGEVSTVAAMVGRLSDLEIDVEDVASILLKHVSGAQSEVHLDYVQRSGMRGCMLVGTEGTIRWDMTEHAIRVYRAGAGTWSVEPLPASWTLNQMYADEMAHFLDCVDRGSETCNPLHQAMHVARIALASKRSGEEGRFVHLDEAGR